MRMAVNSGRRFTRALACLALTGVVLAGCGQATNQKPSATTSALTPPKIVTPQTTAPASDNISVTKNVSDVSDVSADDNATIALVPVTDIVADNNTVAATSETEDIISNIIWDIQAAQKEPVVEPEAVIPEGPDPSLAKDALEAAFAMLARPALPDIAAPQYVLPEKAPDTLRIALLVPVSGPHALLGAELRRGAEMALFAIGDHRLELLVFDSAAEPVPSANGVPIRGAAIAAQQAVDADVDIIIGPLFSDAVMPARAIADRHQIPMLLLSNNVGVSGPNSWLMGYVPEQQLDLVLAHAIAQGANKFAVLAQDSAFGVRLQQHAETRLSAFGFPILESRILTPAELADETALKSAIKAFTRYRENSDDSDDPTILPEPAYDAVIFAGDANFALRTAPVLAYYDIGSDRVAYLGNSLWKQSQLLMEPSLQNSVFAARPSASDTEFTALWTQTWDDNPGLLARLSFDALAMIGLLARDKPVVAEIDWPRSLTDANGFSGFSGAFRLLPDGTNLRAFELRQIVDGSPTLLVQAPDKL